MTLKIKAYALVIGSLWTAAGFAAPRAPKPPAAPTPLVVGIFPGDIERTDLRAISSYHQILYLKQIGQTLIETGPLGEILPGLATSWQVTDAGLTYKFTLRQAKFHNGDPVTATDVVASLNRSIYSTTNVASLYLKAIAGYEDGKATSQASGLIVDGPQAFTIKLSRPFSPLLKVLTSGSLTIAPAKVLAQKPGPNGSPVFVGSGAYQFDKRVGNRVRYKAFREYSGLYPAREQVIEMLSDQTLARGSGVPDLKALPDYDVLVVGPRVPAYQQAADYDVQSTPAMVSGAFYVNLRKTKYKEPSERLKLLKLLQVGANDVKFGHPGQPLRDLLPQGMLGHVGNRPSYQKLMERVSHAKDHTASDEPVCVAFHTMLGMEGAFHDAIKKRTGRDVVFKKLPYVDLMKEWVTHDCDAVFITWQSVFLDPEAMITPIWFIEPFALKSDTAKFAELVATANSSYMDDERAVLFGKVVDFVLDHSVYLPVYQPNQVQALRQRFERSDSFYRYQPMVSEIKRR